MSMNEETAAKLQGLTRRFAKLVHDLKFEDLPEEVLHKAKLIIRDGLGNQVAASAISEPARRVVEIVREWGGKPEATVIGYGFKVPAPLAAMCNAMLGHGVELDDAHGSGLIKGGSVMIPSIMALAEANGKSGRDVITAIVAGYEVAVRIAKAINPGHRQRGFHTTGTVSPFGARPPGRLSCLVATKKASRRRSAWPPCSRRASVIPGRSVHGQTVQSRQIGLQRHHGGRHGQPRLRRPAQGPWNAGGLLQRLLRRYPRRRPARRTGRASSSWGRLQAHAACRYAHGPIDLANSSSRRGAPGGRRGRSTCA